MATDQARVMKNWSEINLWRRERRGEFITARAAIAPGQRKVWNDRITAFLGSGFAIPSGTVIGFCWPYRGEFDSRFALRHWCDRGAIAALPEVVEKARPLQFRKWWPGASMTAGLYKIPTPDGTEVLLPDVAVVPMNGFDEQGYRLGFGGGYFDRTLAALDRRVLAVGVSYEALRMPTAHPQPHDISMDFVVTEAGIYRPGDGKLVLLSAAECIAAAKSLLESRGLPRDRHSPAASSAAGGYSSPACYAHETAPGYFGESTTMPVEELVRLLNVLLEAERAGAKTLAAFLSDYEHGTPAWKQLASVQRDEANNCAILIGLIRRLNGVPSTATGDFLGKALVVEGKTARLHFLNHGQQWVARKIGEALPHLEQGFVRGALAAMHESHLFNIEACDALMETLAAQNARF